MAKETRQTAAEFDLQEQIEEENKMGTMPIGKLLMNMAWPAILSMTINDM